MGLSIWHLLVVLAIALIIFGTKKLRDVGGDLGGAIRNFKTSMKDEDEEAATAESKEEVKKTASIEKKESPRVIEGKVTGRQTQKKKKA